MSTFSKLKYGLKRLHGELVGREDYWHVNMLFRDKDKFDLSMYHLDISKKADYPFKIKDNIPIVDINGIETELVVTILSYGLGLIDAGFEKNKDKLILITKWLKENQETDGSWKTNYADKTYHLKSGWYSGMVQGMAISFFIRIVNLNLFDKQQGSQIIEKALESMISDKITAVVKEQKIIDEYGGTNTGVLNGFVFSLMALWDYGVLKNDFTLFNTYESSLKAILKYYNFGFWSYYDIKGTVASAFYHKLHIQMLMWIDSVSAEPIYKSHIRKWKTGLKLKIIYVLIKAVQKFSNLSKTDTLNT